MTEDSRESTPGQAASNRSVSRRRALQAGAALGVGAAAWTGPQVGVFGTSPAYAQTCSDGEDATVVATGTAMADGCGGTNANNNDGAFTLVALGTQLTTILGQAITAGTCTAGGSTIGVTGGLTCRLSLTISDPGDATKSATVTAGDGNPLTIPSLRRNATGNGANGLPINSEYSLTLRCTSDPADCFI